jgi:hypothetical protein
MRCGIGSNVQHIRPARNRYGGAVSASGSSLRARLHAFEGSVMSLVALLKYAVAVLCVGLWGYGLVDQLDSSASTATYLTITALLVAVARL